MQVQLYLHPGGSEQNQWSLWLAANADIHYFQHPSFGQIFSKNSKYRYQWLAVTRPDGTWIATLAWVMMFERAFILRYATTRTVVYGGPVFLPGLPEPEKQQALDAALKSLIRITRNKSLYIQFRNFYDTARFADTFKRHGFVFSERLNLVKTITHSESAYAEMSPSRCRELRLSHKNGLMIRDAANISEVDQLYGLLQKLYKKKVRKPLIARSVVHGFYHFSVHNNCGKILVAEYKGSIVGGIIAPFTPGGTIFEWYVCGLDKHLKQEKVYPTVSLTWAAMQAGMLQGCHHFDFMGMGIPGKPYGVRNFKARFGGEWVNYGRWMRVNHPKTYKTVELAYNLLRLVKGV